MESDEHSREPGQALVVGSELTLDRRVAGNRVRSLSGGELGSEVQHVNEQARALDVREEVMSQAGPLAGALDQARDVRHDELAILAFEDAEHRREGREGVARHLRRGTREARQQRGLAGIWQAHQADVGEQPEPELQPAFLSGESTLGKAGRLARGRGESLVALAAAATACDRCALPRREQLPAASGQIAAVGAARGGDLRPGRHADRQRLPVGAVTLRPFPVSSAARAVVRPSAEALQVAQGVVAHEDDRSAVSPVAAVGSPAGDVGFPAEARAAVAAGPGLDVDPRAIVKHALHRDSRADRRGRSRDDLRYMATKSIHRKGATRP